MPTKRLVELHLKHERRKHNELQKQTYNGKQGWKPFDKALLDPDEHYMLIEVLVRSVATLIMITVSFKCSNWRNGNGMRVLQCS